MRDSLHNMGLDTLDTKNKAKRQTQLAKRKKWRREWLFRCPDCLTERVVTRTGATKFSVMNLSVDTVQPICDKVAIHGWVAGLAGLAGAPAERGRPMQMQFMATLLYKHGNMVVPTENDTDEDSD